ncbi:MAG: hypothetical protein ACYCPR_11545 [Thermoplasmataceae archaeon]
MKERIIFEKDGVRTTERIENPITGTREIENVVPYSVFEKYPNLNWKVKAIRPLMKNGILTGIELEKENIDSSHSYMHIKSATELKLKAPPHHRYDWYDEYVLEVIRQHGPISRKDIVTRVYERISNELYEGDFYKYEKSGSLRWETMARWAVSRLYEDGKIKSTGNNDWTVT